MNNSITTYQELLTEEKRLQELLKIQRAQLQNDVKELKAEFQPILQVASTINTLTTREDGKNAVVTAGTNLSIDLLVSTVFKRSNFLLRLVLPALLKNLSSHFIPEAKPLKPITVRKKELIGN